MHKKIKPSLMIYQNIDSKLQYNRNIYGNWKTKYKY